MIQQLSYRCIEGIDDLPSAYRQLFDAAEKGSFYFGLDWLSLLARYGLDGSERILLHAVERPDGTPILALPVMILRAGKAWMPRRQESLSNYYTSLFSLVGDRNASDHAQALRILASGIRTSGACDCLNLHPMAKDSAGFAEALSAFRESGWAVQDYFCFGNWYLDVQGRSYAEYSQSLPSVTKNTIKRKAKKFESAQGTLELITDSNKLEEALNDYARIYRSSWKAQEPHPLFVPELIRLSARKGWLRLGIGYVAGEPAAAQIWIVENRVANIYKLAYDERFASLSVGTVLTSFLFQHALDVDKVHMVDYLTGDDPYKRDWMSHRRERWGILAFNLSRIHGLLGLTRHIIPYELKRVARRIRSGNKATS